MTKEKHNCDNVNCNHNNTKGLCCLFNPDNCKYRQLQKENAELKCECRRCVYTDSPCVLSDYEKDRSGICNHFKDVFDENVELKEENKTLRIHQTNAVLQVLEIEVLKNSHRDRANNLQDQLTKAKDLLNEFMRIGKASDEDFEHDYSELIGEADQFLSEVGK